ncbi:MAG: hypothetical protein ACJAQT_003175 [Akkermansiaceae bacterium]|jgi:hypothetical protein
MKKHLTLILTLALSSLSLSLHAQEDIDNIKKWYSEAEGNKTLKTTTYSLDEDGGVMKLKRFVDTKGNVVKVELTAGGAHGSINDIYYYKDGLLFFVLRTEFDWRFTDKRDKNGNQMTIDSALQTRVFLNRTKVLQLLEKSVSTEDAEAVVDILAKAQNKAAKVNESHTWIINLAYAAKFVSSRAELDAFSKLGI